MTSTLIRSLRRRNVGLAAIGAALLLFGAQAASAHSDMPEHTEGMHRSGEFTFGEPGNPAKADRVVNITMSDLSFQPDALTVKAGETIRFVLTNKSGIEHDFTLGDAATQRQHRKEMAEMFKNGGAMHHHDDPNAVMVKPGETAELTWRFTRSGDLEFDCNVPGHSEAGMKGAIAVIP